MDPGGAAALVALLTNGGPWAVVVVVLSLVLRVWRSGEFISKAVHDQIVAATQQRYLDLLDRFNNQQEAIKLWRENAERAGRSGELSQAQHGELLKRIEALQAELSVIHRGLEEFKDDFHGARVWGELGRGGAPDDRPRPPRRPAPREEG